MTETERKKTKYTCPCGFVSYDLMEFLKHPFMGYLNKPDQEASEDREEVNQEGPPPPAGGGNGR
jgi:hypothetical protein